MQVDYKDIFRILDVAKSKVLLQNSRLYWDTEYGERESSYGDKRAIALIESISEVLDLGLEINYRKDIKEYDDI